MLKIHSIAKLALMLHFKLKLLSVWFIFFPTKRINVCCFFWLSINTMSYAFAIPTVFLIIWSKLKDACFEYCNLLYPFFICIGRFMSQWLNFCLNALFTKFFNKYFGSSIHFSFYVFTHSVTKLVINSRYQ